MNGQRVVRRTPLVAIVLGAAMAIAILMSMLVGPVGAQDSTAQESQLGTIEGDPSATSTSTASTDTVAPSSASGNITNFKTVFDTDFTSAGFGGMRDNGNGTITVNGVTGNVTEAYLFWQGPTNSNDSLANANVSFAGQSVTGENIGFSHDNCWGFSNSQAYRADVSSLVTGNGTYSLANFVKPNVNINGASLLVFFDDGNPTNNRDIVVFNGNDSNITNPFDDPGWNVSLSGINYNGGNASLELHVSDGQGLDLDFAHDDAVVLNSQTLVPAGPIFQGNSVPNGASAESTFGGLWDIKAFDITSYLTSGSPNTLTLYSGVFSDCLSLVVPVVNLPAGAAPPPPNQPPTADAGGPYDVNEGDSVGVSATGTDPESGPLTYAWDLDNDGTFDDANTQNATFDASNLDGPTTKTIKVQVTDEQGATATDTAEVTVKNVPPTIQSISSNLTQTLTNIYVSFTAHTTDPSTADTNAGFTYAWSVDGVANSFTSNPLDQSFSDCGDHSVSATATDKDLGESESVSSDIVSVYEAHFRPPLDEDMYNTVQKGRVVPVKISIGCDGANLTGLEPTIQLLKGDKTLGGETGSDAIETYSVSSADTGNTMRPVDGGYIYNLYVPTSIEGTTLKADDLLTIRVRPFGDDTSDMRVVLRIRK